MQKLTIQSVVTRPDIFAETMARMIYYLEQHTDPITWNIRLNTEPDEEMLEIVSIVNDMSYVNAVLYTGENIGIGRSIDFLNSLPDQAEYTLFLEDDWAIDIIGESNIFDAFTSIMDAYPSIDNLVLRRFTSPEEEKRHFFDWRLAKSREQHSMIYHTADYQHHHPIIWLPPYYTNNPHVRRNKSFYNKDVFPLFRDTEEWVESKKDHRWGKTEIEAEKRAHDNGLVTYWWVGGLFVHYDQFVGKDENTLLY